MPPDPRLADEANARFAKAANDLRAAEHALTAQLPLYADSTFHCQQAAEKAMKGTEHADLYAVGFEVL
jgi:HEPN domain-containing protein